MLSVEQVLKQLSAALSGSSADALDDAVQAILAHDDVATFTEALNALVITPGHRSHQQVARALQKIGSRSSIPFVVRALEGGFGIYDYTCSEPEVIAKWFSWILHDIGTPEAIAVIRHYASSAEPAVRQEMLYRLNKPRKI